MINFEILKDKAIRSIYPNVVTIDLSNWKCVDDNNNVINVDDLIVQEKLNELEAAEPLRQLREQRTRILQESDWMSNSDVTMSDAWRTYRQALRDLPANSPNVALDEQGNLINVTWPTKPEA